jgi:hypothetical protein
LNYEIAEIKPGQTKAPDHFLIALDSYLRAELQGGNLTGKETGKNYLVNITIKKYRMRRGFVKRMFGILAGKDGVKSLVTVIDPESDKVIGESFISTTNLTKSVTMDDVAHMHAGEIARFLAGETR